MRGGEGGWQKNGRAKKNGVARDLYIKLQIYANFFSENDYRAFNTAEILVELKTISMFACRN